VWCCGIAGFQVWMRGLKKLDEWPQHLTTQGAGFWCNSSSATTLYRFFLTLLDCTHNFHFINKTFAYYCHIFGHVPSSCYTNHTLQQHQTTVLGSKRNAGDRLLFTTVRTIQDLQQDYNNILLALKADDERANARDIHHVTDISKGLVAVDTFLKDSAVKLHGKTAQCKSFISRLKSETKQSREPSRSFQRRRERHQRLEEDYVCIERHEDTKQEEAQEVTPTSTRSRQSC
jgi:hypothetical protein